MACVCLCVYMCVYACARVRSQYFQICFFRVCVIVNAWDKLYFSLYHLVIRWREGCKVFRGHHIKVVKAYDHNGCDHDDDDDDHEGR